MWLVTGVVGEGLTIVLFLRALHILTSTCAHHGLPLGRWANSQVTVTWRATQFMEFLKGWGRAVGPGGDGWPGA